MKKEQKHSPARRKAAALARELRTVKTPSLTMRERNGAIRSHVRQALRNYSK
jgi:hypothetical protein